ncbi:unnamed protein product [Mesocestoides corti]|uniref:Synaptotagmin n=1 Tax=Mesocestoides corti TaxID=53468 RepID=A0A0R3UH53_MESCO|nr:unnamed protein product [Mesocestoides corti]
MTSLVNTTAKNALPPSDDICHHCNLFKGVGISLVPVAVALSGLLVVLLIAVSVICLTCQKRQKTKVKIYAPEPNSNQIVGQPKETFCISEDSLLNFDAIFSQKQQALLDSEEEDVLFDWDQCINDTCVLPEFAIVQVPLADRALAITIDLDSVVSISQSIIAVRSWCRHKDMHGACKRLSNGRSDFTGHLIG